MTACRMTILFSLLIDGWTKRAGYCKIFQKLMHPHFWNGWPRGATCLPANVHRPAHQDFHPGNILISADDGATVIDWTNFAVTDSRFDLAWTLVLAHAYGGPELRDQILQGYQHHAGKPVKQIEAFEAIACARRLFDLTVSLTQGAQRMGMNAQAVEAMRANMDAHRRVHRLFIERTGLQIEAFDNLFG